MKFQNPNIHLSKVSNFTEKWKNQSKFQNSVFLSKFDGKFSKVNQVIYSSAPTSIPNMKALAQILFEISCTQDFQSCSVASVLTSVQKQNVSFLQTS